jgi:hypothetical protein
MEKYVLTPFDERYLKTPFEWMEFMYTRFWENLDYGDLKNVYLRDKFKKERDRETDEGIMNTLEKYSDFTPAEMEDVLEAFRTARQ